VVDRSGKEIVLDLRELAQGKPLHLNFWASWCPPCVAEIPDLQALSASGKARVVAIGLDAPDDRAKAEKLLRERGGRFDAYYLPPEAEAGAAGISVLVDLDRLPIPTTLVLSPEGRLESIVRGPIRAQ
jgi:thiol-disulfide isomerase/thioredoxin